MYEITTGELDRRLGRMEDHIGQGVADLRSDIRILTESISENYVRKDVLDERLKPIEEKIDNLQSWKTWILRGLVASVMMAILAAAGFGTGTFG